MLCGRSSGVRKKFSVRGRGRIILMVLAAFLLISGMGFPRTGGAWAASGEQIGGERTVDASGETESGETAASFDEESEAAFDEEPAGSEGAGHAIMRRVTEARDKFNIKLYMDFMYEQSFGGDEDSAIKDPRYESFSSNHTYLLISANPTEELRVGFDISFDEYFEIEYALTPRLFVKGGLIFLPFGDFRYHAIYGGKVYGIDNDLFPNWFTDYGIGMEHDVLDTEHFHLKYGLFVSNGFQSSFDGRLNMNSIGYSSDNNSEKAFGGRIKGTLFGGWSATLSAMHDDWADEGDGSLFMWALELASVRGIADLPVLDRMNLKLGYLRNHVENDREEAAGWEDYDAFGSYLELNFKAAGRWRLAFRMGEVDANENVKDEMDQRNYNASLMYTVNENLHLLGMYQRNEEKYVDEIDNDYLMVKAIVEF